MFIPFLAGNVVAAEFDHMGAQLTKIAVLSSTVNALVVLMIAIAARHSCRP